MLWGDHWGEPWGGPIVPTFADVVVRGEQLVRVYLPDYSDPFGVLESIDSWSVSPSPPRIALAELAEGGAALDLYFDRKLAQGVTYTITLLSGYLDPWIPAGATGTFIGPRRSITVAGELAELLDIDAPIIRPDRPGGDYTIGEGGDYTLTGGAATVLKMAWDAVLTVFGELSYDRQYGARLRHKRPAQLGIGTVAHEREIVEVLEAVPYIDAASARIEVADNHARISLTLGTRFGRVEDAREVSQ